ncbi:MAG: hypothetical protein E6Q24_15285 [Chitinophagaceae bacterium]|nr:MAG: hypothetical protein E6Q24_15285 [Chitinophagaceae bacterium]
MNATVYINSYFVHERNNEGIDGTIVKVIEAKKYLNLMRLGVENLNEIFFRSKEDNFVITDRLKSYLSYTRTKYPFESPDDKRLLNSHAFNYLNNFSEVRDFLIGKGDDILRITAIALSVQIEKT